MARSNSFQYHVCLSSGIHVKVCKQAFYQIHPIGKRHVKHLCEKLVSGVLFSGDEHGKHKHRPHTTSEDLKAQIQEHISSFPSRESHYSCHDNKK